MGLNHSPKIITDGLVFAYDMANTKKSWKGAPTTNLYPIDSYITWPSVTYHFWNGNNWVIDATYTHPGVEGPQGVYIGKVRKYTSGALSATWSGNSYAYILKSAVMTSGQAYAMSAYSFVSSDCNIDGMNSSIEGVGASTMSGVATGYNMAKKGTWQRQGLTCIAPATSINFIPIYPYKNGVTTGVFTGFFMVGGAMVETGSFPTPYTDDTRSNTQALIDLTGRSTATASALTYNSDNSFEFNYANSAHVSVPLSTAFNKTTGTMNFWVYPTRYNGGNGYFVNREDATPNATDWFWIGPYSDTFYFRLGNGADCCSNDLSFSSVSTVIPLNTWTNMCFTWVANGTSAIYKNGNLLTSRTIGNVPATNPASNGRIGLGHSNLDNYFHGKMSNVSIYNRALTAAEVKQNFNAIRGRYSI